MNKAPKKKNFFYKFLTFLLSVFGIKKKDKDTDDIYPMW